jgi:hypothetical protein
MHRGVLNLLLDTVAAALLTALVGTGYLLVFVLPPRTNRTHILWGLLRHQCGTVHAGISVLLLTVLAGHVALHWRWLVMGLSRRFGVAAWATRLGRIGYDAVAGALVGGMQALAMRPDLTRSLNIPLLHLQERLRDMRRHRPPGRPLPERLSVRHCSQCAGTPGLHPMCRSGGRLCRLGRITSGNSGSWAETASRPCHS